MQINHVTKMAYSGANQDTLTDMQRAQGYESNEWLTFVQALHVGRVVKKGERGIVLGRILEREDETTKQKKRSMRRFVVFNLEQTERLPVNTYVRD